MPSRLSNATAYLRLDVTAHFDADGRVAAVTIDGGHSSPDVEDALHREVLSDSAETAAALAIDAFLVGKTITGPESG